MAGFEDSEVPGTAAAETLRIVKEFLDSLRTGAVKGGGWFVDVTALDAHFGLGGDMRASIAAAGTMGIVKTLRREYPRLRFKNIDMELNMPADMLAARLLQEMTVEDSLVEVGLLRTDRG